MSGLVAKIKAGNWFEWFAWPAWLVACFLAALIIGGVAAGLGVWLGYGNLIDSTLGGMAFGAFVYVVMGALLVSIARMRYVIALPSATSKVIVVVGAVVAIYALHTFYAVSFGVLALLGIAACCVFVFSSVPAKRRVVSKENLGIARSISWGDMGLGLAGYVVYFMIFVAVTVALAKLVPAYNSDQAQDLGFTALFGIERTIGFIVLVVVTPIAEELIMRGFLFGKLREAKMPLWPAAVIVSILFGVAHGQWNVGIDTFVLSMVGCYLRETTGTIWPGVIIHMLKNAVAYIMLFVFVLR